MVINHNHLGFSLPAMSTPSALHPAIERAAQHGVVLEMQGAVAVVRLCRPSKRNALSDSLIEALRDVFQNLPEQARAAVVHGEGETFLADLARVAEAARLVVLAGRGDAYLLREEDLDRDPDARRFVGPADGGEVRDFR